MNEKNRGFTLIEMLAVIVVLALIMVIAVPLVLKTIEGVKQGAFKNSAYAMVKAAELEYAKQVLQGTFEEIIYTYENGEETSSINKELEIKGEKPKNGEIRINKEGEIALAIHDGTYCAEKGYGETEVIVTQKEINECIINGSSDSNNNDSGVIIVPEFDEEKGVNKPVLTSGMTLIKWDEELNEIETTEEDEDWYDYNEKRWANAKTKDRSYWVWIPRYAYKITSCFH